MSDRIYIHIPFCQRKCLYCAFISKTGSAAEIDNYVHLLTAEMRLSCRQLPPLSPTDSLYFGGGTPSLLQPAQVGAILDLADNLFTLTSNPEITLETNPGTVDQRKLEGYRRVGVNRLSIGVQSFHDTMLATLGRIHTAQQADRCVAAAHRAGFDNIGIDLIHTLPGQTPGMWRADLQRALALTPSHISIYGLTIEEGTPFAGRYDENAIPDQDISADMFETAHEMLTGAGYEHYEIANYTLPGFRSRHNSGYWKRDWYLGLGCGAHSFIRGGKYGVRFGNTPELDEYASSITSGELPRKEKIELTRQDAMAEFMFLGLRLSDGVAVEDFEAEFGVTLKERFGREVRELADQGLVTADQRRIRLTVRGMLLSNRVFIRFLE